MKKDIYVVINNVNNKCYVGQSVDANKRFKSHLRANENVALHKAILKYGKENFSMFIIEHQIDNYNEMERYWIEKLNTILPYGYNMTDGGEGYPHPSGIQNYQSTISEEQLIEIKNLLSNTNMTQESIASRFNITQETVSRINIGKSYKDENINYPIRKPEKLYINQIRDLLINTHISFNNIAKMFDIQKSTVNNIDKGYSSFDYSYTYPLRKIPNRSKLDNEDALLKIKDLLENSKMSTDDIGKLFGVTRGSIEKINQGKTYFNEEWIYPLRKASVHRIKFSKDEVNQIINELKNSGKSFRKIAKEHDTVHSIIQGINNGTIKSYYRDNIVYPIRSRY